MNISYNWLKNYIKNIPSVSEVSEILTSIGLEVESIEHFESLKGGLKNIVISKVLTCEKHPNADKLSKTTVDIGSQILPIVCGAPNVATGQTVVVAIPGATLYPIDSEPFTIKKTNIRGEVSEGMICAEDEIGLGKSHAGIMVLPNNLIAGSSASEYFQIETDSVFCIGLTPNRIDAASHLGVARDLYAAITEQKSTEIEFTRAYKKNFKLNSEKPSIEIKIENTSSCFRYAGAVVRNIKIKPSPIWLQNKLKSIGVNPINNIVDITNYILHDLGQPLHAFDLSKIKGNKIIIKNAKEKEKFITLDGKERTLFASDLMICNAEESMCIAGVFGGLNSGVNNETNAIFVESAYFVPDFIRKTSQNHGLKTDASFRFERGSDPNMVVYALEKSLQLISEICKDAEIEISQDYYPLKVKNFIFDVNYNSIKKLIGIDIPKGKILSILDSLEINIYSETKDGVTVSVPPYRVDVQREADIVEEIVRIYGFNNIGNDEYLGTTYLSTFAETTPLKIENKIANLLVAKGFNEIMTNSLTKPEYSLKPENDVQILNKLSPELGVMRQSMLFSGLEAIAYNNNRKQKHLKFFEFGNVYQKISNNKEVKDYKESQILSIFLTGNTHQESWFSPSKSSSFFDIAAAVQSVLFSLNIDFTISKDPENELLSECISILKGNKIIGIAGKVKPTFAKKADVKATVYYAELHIDEIKKYISTKVHFKEIAKFPEVKRDLSLVINKNITFAEIEKIALKTEKKLLKDLQVFDVYEGDKIASDKKAYAISFILQDEENTLSDKQIEITMSKFIEVFTKELGAEIRS
ncbi:MAG: phenylalanine--tRNA ligase subunit beta [Cytophagales bacterium]|nr:MAG: phenylalanine--tRNA ligase subunit beta [Cytophagales bacterium]